MTEIDHGPSKFEVFLEENQKLLITLSVVTFLGVLAYVGYTGYNDMLSAQAGEALTSAEEESELEAIISAHGNTASAGAAVLLLADIKSNKSSEDAISALRDFVAIYPNHAAIPTATTSLGLHLLNNGKLSDAEVKLNKVLDMENADFIKPVAQIALGDIAKQNGDKDRAKEHYMEVTNLVSDTDISAINKYAPYKYIANTRLRFLDAAAPTEVEKKPAPTTDVTPTPEAPAAKNTEEVEKVKINSQTSK